MSLTTTPINIALHNAARRASPSVITTRAKLGSSVKSDVAIARRSQ